MKSKLFIITIILLGIFTLISCEKETEIAPTQKPTNLTDFSQYVDFSFYPTEKLKAADGEGAICGLYYLPYYFTYRQEVGTNLDEECACLPTTCGDCFPEVTIRAKSTEINTVNYDIFKTYNDDVVSYFTSENWKELLPMLKQHTVDLIIEGDLALIHKYSRENKIAYFSVVNPNEAMKNVFTIQLKIEQ